VRTNRRRHDRRSDHVDVFDGAMRFRKDVGRHERHDDNAGDDQQVSDN
jgi:hypothetical protein